MPRPTSHQRPAAAGARPQLSVDACCCQPWAGRAPGLCKPPGPAPRQQGGTGVAEPQALRPALGRCTMPAPACLEGPPSAVPTIPERMLNVPSLMFEKCNIMEGKNETSECMQMDPEISRKPIEKLAKHPGSLMTCVQTNSCFQKPSFHLTLFPPQRVEPPP